MFSIGSVSPGAIDVSIDLVNPYAGIALRAPLTVGADYLIRHGKEVKVPIIR